MMTRIVCPGPCERCGRTAVELSVTARKFVNGRAKSVRESRVFVTTGPLCAMCNPEEYLRADRLSSTHPSIRNLPQQVAGPRRAAS